MRGIRITVAIVAFVVVLAPASVLADTVTLPPIKDNTLYEPIDRDNFEDRSNGAGETMFTGRVKDAFNASGQVAVRRAVLAFDIASNIPAGSTINSVTLHLRCTRARLNTNFNVSLHELLTDWGEGTSDTGNSQQGRGETPTTGDATWRHTFYSTQFWVTPGGDYAITASATTPVGNTGSYSWGSTSGMVADVQNWLDNPAENFGWNLIGDEDQNETAKQFGTRENTRDGGANKPELIIDYTPQQISGACCQTATCTIETPLDCSTLGGAYQGDGTSCSPNPCVEPFGACCANDGTCSEDTESNCDGAGGVFQGDGSTCATVDCPIALTPYLDPLPVPGPATPVSGQSGGTATYDLTMKEFQQQLHAELPPATVWGFDDGFAGPSTPGPLIEARTGQPVTVNWINDIRELGSGALRTSHYLQQSSDDLSCTHGAQDEAKTVVHLHGGHVPAAVDGYPESTFLPGAPAVTYLYPNDQQAAPIWFHDHALGITRLNVYMGLAGLYFIRDDVEDGINLPADPYEIPLVLQDRKFNPGGTLFYPGTWQDHFFGDKVMVNGKVWPYLEVKQGKYRFRLLNGSGSRVYTLSLNPPSGSMTFTVIGNEGGLLEAPARGVSALTLGPGERYDVVVDFEPYANNDEILLENSAPAPFPNGTVDVTQVMKFVVTNQGGDTDPVPNTLRTIEQLQEADAVMTRDFVLKKSGLDACGRAFWEINGLHWDDITEYPELGTTEIWRFINDSGVSHPMHMHLVFFQVLDRDGFTRGAGGEIVPDGTPQSPPLEESGWKDTAMVGPNEILRVIARFEDYKGLYAYHCHILEHEDHEMMRQFRTQLCGDDEVDPTEECDDGGESATCDADCTAASCGDGTLNATAGEDCDDGNTTPGDGCGATCLIELGYTCPTPGAPCEQVCIDVDLSIGWNMVGPAVNLGYSASGLCADIAGDGDSAEEVDRYVDGGWVGHICDLPFNDFSIEPGIGYFVKMNSEATWCQLAPRIDSPLNVPLLVGWNGISVPAWAEGWTAEGVCQEITAQGGSAQEIDQFVNGGWESHICGLPFNSFDLVPGRGYFVLANASSTWELSIGDTPARADRTRLEAKIAATGLKTAALGGAAREREHRLGRPAKVVEGPYIANQTDTAFAVIWKTDRPTQGSVTVIEPNGLIREIKDVRGADHISRVHYALVEGLVPNREYQVQVNPALKEMRTVQTGPTLDIPKSVARWDEIPAVDDAAVVLVSLDPGRRSGYLASLVENGYWTANLGNLRTDDLRSYVTAAEDDDLVLLVMSEGRASFQME